MCTRFLNDVYQSVLIPVKPCGVIYRLTHIFFFFLNRQTFSQAPVVTHVVSQPQMVIFRILHSKEGGVLRSLVSSDCQTHNDRVRPVEQHAIFWIFCMDFPLFMGYDLCIFSFFFSYLLFLCFFPSFYHIS